MPTRNAAKTTVVTGVAAGIRCLLVIVALAVTTTTVWPADSKGDIKSDNKLVGTWKLISAKYDGQDFKYPEGLTTVKHVTPTQFMWVTYDKEGKVTRAAGGSYVIKGEVYEETPEYGISSDFDEIKGKAHRFKWKVEGNKWYHNGKLSGGMTIEEVWERIDKK
jgi:hypothetical protein